MAPKSAHVQEELNRELMTQRSAIAALEGHPSWENFLEVLREKREKINKRILARTLNMADPMSEREAGYMVGYLDGISWLARQPHTATVQLERQLERQGGDT